jgi:basic amino acid/polyamine antiporter, APA family
MVGAPGTEPDGVPARSYSINLFAVLPCLLIAFAVVLLGDRGRRVPHRHDNRSPFAPFGLEWLGLIIAVGAVCSVLARSGNGKD